MQQIKQKWLDNKRIVVATKHQKERVIYPLFLEFYNCTFLSIEIDTDLLGTFSGEIERTLSPYETAIEKCRMAFKTTDADFAIASEGTFGPHPSLFFVPADEEFILFMSRDEQLIIWAKHISTETNYNQIENQTDNQLSDFLEKVQFPSHKVIFKSNTRIEKGINNLNFLNQLIRECELQNVSFSIETDMRAHCNPTRMKVIEETTSKLLEKLNSFCPSCETPGFSVQEVVKGLPCAQCGLKTESTLKHIKICTSCNHKEDILYPRGIQIEDPMYCPFCNP
jgi:hypothetical protein